MRVMKARTKSSPRPFLNTLLESGILRSLWIAAFIGLCALFYVYGIQKKDGTYRELLLKTKEFEEQKAAVLKHREDLMLQIQSQSDPAWIQMTLMKGLGVVPEGQLKVYFKKDSE